MKRALLGLVSAALVFGLMGTAQTAEAGGFSWTFSIGGSRTHGYRPVPRYHPPVVVRPRPWCPPVIVRRPIPWRPPVYVYRPWQTWPTRPWGSSHGRYGSGHSGGHSNSRPSYGSGSRSGGSQPRSGSRGGNGSSSHRSRR